MVLNEIGMYIFLGTIFILGFIDSKKGRLSSEQLKELERLDAIRKAQEIVKSKREWERQQRAKEIKVLPTQPPVDFQQIRKNLESEAPKPPVNFTAEILEEINQATNKPQWTLELLMLLEWKRFEDICKEFLIMTGHDAELTQIGPDAGIDIKIYQNNELVNIVQCKAWTWKVSVKEVRELYGIMASEKVNNGMFITTSSFTQEAIIFSSDKNIKLIDGQSLIKQINYLPPEKQDRLMNLATAGDYITPTCPRCNERMVKRNGRYGDFWGCSNFPRCRHKQKIRKA